MVGVPTSTAAGCSTSQKQGQGKNDPFVQTYHTADESSLQGEGTVFLGS